ncbi:hypothetical protein B0H11DRAFT_2370265 [Mycena galericulata]|nr:hypothetical protein B0H11DRAFT_2370265 [Mycena galericulata]
MSKDEKDPRRRRGQGNETVGSKMAEERERGFSLGFKFDQELSAQQANKSVETDPCAGKGIGRGVWKTARTRNSAKQILTAQLAEIICSSQNWVQLPFNPELTIHIYAGHFVHIVQFTFGQPFTGSRQGIRTIFNSLTLSSSRNTQISRKPENWENCGASARLPLSRAEDLSPGWCNDRRCPFLHGGSGVGTRHSLCSRAWWRLRPVTTPDCIGLGPPRGRITGPKPYLSHWNTPLPLWATMRAGKVGRRCPPFFPPRTDHGQNSDPPGIQSNFPVLAHQPQWGFPSARRPVAKHEDDGFLSRTHAPKIATNWQNFGWRRAESPDGPSRF